MGDLLMKHEKIIEHIKSLCAQCAADVQCSKVDEKWFHGDELCAASEIWENYESFANHHCCGDEH
jgi:hypothetical protein